MAISFFTEDISFTLKKKREIKKRIKSVIVFHKKTIGEINIIFTSEEKILQINRQFLNHNYFTDIITFPYTEGKLLSADIFICIPTVKSNAKTFNQTFEIELNRVIVHGVLHLLGFNDKTLDEKTEMREQENIWISPLNK